MSRRTTTPNSAVPHDDWNHESTAPETGDQGPILFVQSFARGLAVIRAFDADHSQLTLSDVARITGLTRAAARRFLHTLHQLGYVHATGRQFSLRPKVLELGFAYLSSMSLIELAAPHLENLAVGVGESAYLSVLDGEDIACVSCALIKRIWTASIGVGTRLPAYATASGRVLLAALDDAELDAYLSSASLQRLTANSVTDRDALISEIGRVRRQGWALVDQELEEGPRAVAAPVRDRSGAVVAAVSISKLAGVCTLDETREGLLAPILAAAAAIEEDLRRLG